MDKIYFMSTFPETISYYLKKSFVLYIYIYEEFGYKNAINPFELIWEKCVFFTKKMARWKPLVSVSNFHIANLGYNNVNNSNPDFDFKRFIIKTHSPTKMQ